MQRSAVGGARGKLVVIHPERKAQRALQRMVGAAGVPIEIAADVASASLDADTIVIADAALAASRVPARAWIAVPGEGLAAAEASVVAGLLESGCEHVIAHPMPVLAEELLATVQKLLKRDVFGLDKYLTWAADVRSYTLEDALDRDVAVSELAREVVAMGLPDRVGSLVSVIADELLANAIYAAPVDDNGERIHAADRREQPRSLRGRDVVTLRWATDARYLALEIRDRWGSIDPAACARRLAKAQSSTGGMGLPLAYACCNQLVVNRA
ncbi:MAG TPA: hypothetical protein VLT45_29410, partial [Kofleriaceae bacterium]|nr:hypothetical protein [Kofleriaceae bacterium]